MGDKTNVNIELPLLQKGVISRNYRVYSNAVIEKINNHTIENCNNTKLGFENNIDQVGTRNNEELEKEKNNGWYS